MKKLLLLSTLMSVLIVLPSYAQEAVAQQLPESFKISSYIKLKGFFWGLSALCTEDDHIERKDLIRLLKYVKTDKIAQAFAIDPNTFSRYFHAKYFKRFIEHALDVDSEEKKAKAFRKAFKVDAWEQALGCNNLTSVLEPLSQVLFLKSDDSEYDEQLALLKTALHNLGSRDDDSHPLDDYLNIQLLLELLNKKQAGTDVSASEIINTFHIDRVLTKISGNTDRLRKYANLRKSFASIASICCAHSKEQLPKLIDIATCVRWDAILLGLPDMCGQDDRLLRFIFNEEPLRDLIEAFQEGTELTAQDIEAVLNKEAVEFLGITPERLHLYLDSSLLATGLNNLRAGKPASEIYRACNMKKIGKLIGMEPHQDDWVSSIRKSIPAFCGTNAAWLVGLTLCPNSITALVPDNISTTALLLGGLGYGSYRASEYLKNMPISQRVPVNALICKGTRDIKRKLGMNPTIQEQIMGWIPQAHPLHGYLAEFIDLLSEEHIQTLSDPTKLINVYLDPYDFIKTEEDFIESICLEDPEHAHLRIDYIWDQLERVRPYEALNHTQEFTQFAELLVLKGDALDTLPHRQYLDLAQYHPKMLMKHHDFIGTTASRFFNKKSLVTILSEAIEKSEEN